MCPDRMSDDPRGDGTRSDRTFVGTDRDRPAGGDRGGDDVRTLRRIALEEGWTGRGDPEANFVAAVLDVETNGLDIRDNAVIELAIRRIRHDADGIMTRVGRPRSWLEDPGRPLPQEVASLTGLTYDDLMCQSID